MYYHAESYKKSDRKAVDLANLYNQRLVDAPKYRKAELKKDKASSQQQGTPRTWDGQPPATRGWHSETAEYADRARVQFTDAIAQRRYMAEQYIGYDTREGAAGHKQRITGTLSGQEYYHQEKTKQHRSTHGR